MLARALPCYVASIVWFSSCYFDMLQIHYLRSAAGTGFSPLHGGSFKRVLLVHVCVQCQCVTESFCVVFVFVN